MIHQLAGLIESNHKRIDDDEEKNGCTQCECE